MSQARLYVVTERFRWVEFGHRAAVKTRYPVAFRLPGVFPAVNEENACMGALVPFFGSTADRGLPQKNAVG